MEGIFKIGVPARDIAKLVKSADEFWFYDWFECKAQAQVHDYESIDLKIFLS
jgi:hypothetical protein